MLTDAQMSMDSMAQSNTATASLWREQSAQMAYPSCQTRTVLKDWQRPLPLLVTSFWHQDRWSLRPCLPAQERATHLARGRSYIDSLGGRSVQWSLVTTIGRIVTRIREPYHCLASSVPPDLTLPSPSRPDREWRPCTSERAARSPPAPPPRELCRLPLGASSHYRREP